MIALTTVHGEFPNDSVTISVTVIVITMIVIVTGAVDPANPNDGGNNELISNRYEPSSLGGLPTVLSMSTP